MRNKKLLSFLALMIGFLSFSIGTAEWSVSNAVVKEIKSSNINTQTLEPIAFLSSSLSTKKESATDWYYTIESAINAANSGSKKIVTIVPGNKSKQDDRYMIKSNVTINSGVTLNIPYADGSTNSEKGSKTSDDSAPKNALFYESTYLQSCVTIKSGVTLTNNGTIEIGGIIFTANGGSKASITGGNYAEIYLNSGSRIISSGTVKCFGSINCDQTSGYKPYVIFSGGTLRVPFNWQFCGGTTMKTLYDNSSTYRLAPIREFYFRNITANIRVFSGTNIIGWVSLNTSQGQGDTTINLVSKNSDTILKIPDNSFFDIVTTIHANSANDNDYPIHEFFFVGGMTVGSLIIDVEAAVKASAGSGAWILASLAGIPSKVNTNVAFFPITNQYNVSLLQSSVASVKVGENTKAFKKVSTISKNTLFADNVQIQKDAPVDITLNGKKLGYYSLIKTAPSGFTSFNNRFSKSDTTDQIICKSNGTYDIYITNQNEILFVDSNTAAPTIDQTSAIYDTTAQDFKILNGGSVFVGTGASLSANKMVVYKKYNSADANPGWNGAALSGFPAYDTTTEGALKVDGSFTCNYFGGVINSDYYADSSFVINTAKTLSTSECSGGGNASYVWSTFTNKASANLYNSGFTHDNIIVGEIYNGDTEGHWDGLGGNYLINVIHQSEVDGFDPKKATPQPFYNSSATFSLEEPSYSDNDDIAFANYAFDAQGTELISVNTQYSLKPRLNTIISNGHKLDVYATWISNSAPTATYIIDTYDGSGYVPGDEIKTAAPSTIALDAAPKVNPVYDNPHIYVYTFTGWTVSKNGSQYEPIEGNTYSDFVANDVLEFRPTFSDSGNTYLYPTVTMSDVTISKGSDHTTVTATISGNYNSSINYIGNFTDNGNPNLSLSATKRNGNTFTATITEKGQSNHDGSGTTSKTFKFELKFYVGDDIGVYGTVTNTATVKYYNENSECLLPETLITLSDGTYKMVKDLSPYDSLLAFDHETGELVSSPMFYQFEAHNVKTLVTYLTFDNGKEIGIITSHGFYDVNEDMYIRIDANNFNEYIGHSFYTAKMINGAFCEGSAKLIGGYNVEMVTDYYSPVSKYTLNSFTEDFLSVPDDHYDLINFWEFDNMVISQDKKNELINTYGTWEYDVLSQYMSYEIYDAYNLKYLPISIGQGYMTTEKIQYMINKYVPALEEYIDKYYR